MSRQTIGGDEVREVDRILGAWRERLGPDLAGYRNHVCRVIAFFFALRDPSAEERRKIVLAACFHDLGIWSHRTFDYLEPSIALARHHLTAAGLASWGDEVARMIEMHHKLRPCRDPRQPLVELFRRADLIDLSLGLVRCGLPRPLVREVRRRFPNAGFHRRLVRLAAGRLLRHPLNPLPVVKW